MVTDPPITRRRAMLAGITGLTGMSALNGCIENPNEPRLSNSDPDTPDGDWEKDGDRYEHENDAPAWFLGKGGDAFSLTKLRAYDGASSISDRPYHPDSRNITARVSDGNVILTFTAERSLIERILDATDRTEIELWRFTDLV